MAASVDSTPVRHRMPYGMSPALVGAGPLARLQPLSGLAFIVCFIGSVIASSPPANNAADQKWIANYTGSANHAHHILTGVLLVLAGISLLTFLSSVWTRIARATTPVLPNPLPLVAAAAGAACMAAGGMVMGATYIAVNNSKAPNATSCGSATASGSRSSVSPACWPSRSASPVSALRAAPPASSGGG